MHAVLVRVSPRLLTNASPRCRRLPIGVGVGQLSVADRDRVGESLLDFVESLLVVVDADDFRGNLERRSRGAGVSHGGEGERSHKTCERIYAAGRMENANGPPKRAGRDVLRTLRGSPEPYREDYPGRVTEPHGVRGRGHTP